jgi:hypothetical protein
MKNYNLEVYMHPRLCMYKHFDLIINPFKYKYEGILSNNVNLLWTGTSWFLLELGEKKFVLERDPKESVFDVGGLHT